MTQFGLLSKLDILQTIPSVIISKINPAIFHNIGKYLAIKKAFYLSSIEEIEGDYFEFGVFTGSSFCHAVRCAKANERFDDKLKEMHFFGLILSKALANCLKVISTDSILILILRQIMKKFAQE